MRSDLAYTQAMSHAAIGAAFLRNHRGQVCIAFADPSYVKADIIVIERDACRVRAIIDDENYMLGHVSEAMADAFAESKQALLTALQSDGSVFEHVAPIQLQ